MLPSLRQRLIITAAAALGALAWLPVLPLLRPHDASRGISLFTSHAGASAIAIALLAGVPALIGGAVAAAAGNYLAGAFAIAAALATLAAFGGPIDGWMYHAHPPADYRWLMLESVIWFAFLVASWALIYRLRAFLRPRLPAPLIEEHVTVDSRIGAPGGSAIAAALLTAAVAALLTCLMVPNSDTGQVTCGLAVAFALAAIAGQLTFPQVNPLPILLSPLLVALGAYAYVLFGFDSTDRLHAAWYARDLPGVALILPIFYASSAVAGCAAGIGVAQSMDAQRLRNMAAKAAG